MKYFIIDAVDHSLVGTIGSKRLKKSIKKSIKGNGFSSYKEVEFKLPVWMMTHRKSRYVNGLAEFTVINENLFFKNPIMHPRPNNPYMLYVPIMLDDSYKNILE